MQRAMTRALVEGVDMPNSAADAPAAGKEVTDLFLVSPCLQTVCQTC